MNVKISRYKLLLGSIGLISLLIILTERAFYFLHQGFFNGYEKAFLEPMFTWLIAIAVATSLLYLIPSSKFNLWFTKVFSWYVPLGLVLTFLSNTNLSYAFPDRIGVATILGFGLVVATVVFVITQFILDWKQKS